MTDLEWATERFLKMQGISEANAALHGPKLLKGHGFPDEVMRDAMDAQMFQILRAEWVRLETALKEETDHATLLVAALRDKSKQHEFQWVRAEALEVTLTAAHTKFIHAVVPLIEDDLLRERVIRAMEAALTASPVAAKEPLYPDGAPCSKCGQVFAHTPECAGTGP